MKAIGLFSGGLDSALAIKLVQGQGIEVIALNYVSPFCTCTGKGCSIVELAKRLGVQIKLMNKGMDYLKVVRNPKHGYGKNMNPCIDCKIYILKGAKRYAKEIGAKFVFTGEVLGQRPMSQHYQTLMLIEKEAGLQGKLVRPLCAGLLPPTESEQKGWIDRSKLLKFEGRTRVPQIDLAKKFKIDGFMCGGSGCRLTDKEYSDKLRDLFENKKHISIEDIKLLSLGRHFRLGKNKIIVGRNKEENDSLTKMKETSDYLFEAKDIMGPITLLQGPKTRQVIKLAASLTARYSDAKTDELIVIYGKNKEKQILSKKIPEEILHKLRITRFKKSTA